MSIRDKLYLALSVILAGFGSTADNWRVVANADDYFQIASGRWILSNGFPDTDFISWTSNAIHPTLVAHEWLCQVVMAGIHAFGGFRAINAYTLLVGLGIFSLLAAWACIRSFQPKAVAALVLVCGALASLQGLEMRAQTTSLLILLGLAVSLELGGRWRWLGVLLLVVGANWHGGFWPIYMIVAVYYAIRDRCWWLLASPLVLLLNPYGAEILRLPFTYASQTHQYQELVGEWRRTTFWPTDGTDTLLSFLSATALLGGIYVTRPRAEEWLMPAATLALAASGYRYLILVPLLGLPSLFPSLMSWWGKKSESGVPGLLVRRRGLLISMALTVSITALSAASVLPLLSVSAWSDTSNRSISARYNDLNSFIDYAQSHRIERLLNIDFGEGGYLAFAGIQPFIDNRTDVYLFIQPNGHQVWADYTAALKKPESLNYLVEEYGVEWVLARKDSPRELFLKVSPRKYRYVDNFGRNVLYRVTHE